MEELLIPVFRALGAVLHGLSSVLDVLSATTTKTGSKRTDNILRYLLWVLLAILVITFMVSFLT